MPLTEESELRRNLHPYPPGTLQHMRKIFPWMTDDYDKIPAERIVMNDGELPGTVLRLPMMYGPGDPLHRFYPVVKRIADGRRHIIFAETLAAWRSPRGYVENVAAAIALAATDERAARRIYNVCEEPSFSELEWALENRQRDAVAIKVHVTLPRDRTPPHLMKLGNAAQHWSCQLGAHPPRIRIHRADSDRRKRSGARLRWERAESAGGEVFYRSSTMPRKTQRLQTEEVTAGPSASLGMTKGRVALPLALDAG